jgi:hypothetical protein
MFSETEYQPSKLKEQLAKFLKQKINYEVECYASGRPYPKFVNSSGPGSKAIFYDISS